MITGHSTSVYREVARDLARRMAVAAGLVGVLLHGSESHANAQTLGTYRLSNGWATFGVALPSGSAQNGIAVGSLPSQTDVKNRWPDGSIRFAVVSAYVPTTADYNLTPTSASTGQMTPSWPAASVRFDVVSDPLRSSGTYTATLPAFSASDPWLNGPLVREQRVVVVPTRSDGSQHSYLRVVFDVRAYGAPGSSNAGHRVDVAVQNMLQDRGDSIVYNAAIVLNGQTVFSKSSFKHFYLTRWRKKFVTAGLRESDVTPDTNLFMDAKALPRFASTISNVVSDVSAADRVAQFDIGKRGGLSVDYMPNVGGRSEIAPYPDWVARYMVHKNPTTKEYMLRTDDLAGSWPVHVTDNNNQIARFDRAPGSQNYWFDGRGSDKPAGNFYDPAQTLIPDNAHCPSLGYASYLVTGDRYYADELKFWASYNFLNSYPDDYWYPRLDRSDISPRLNGLVLSNQVRGIAWTLRNMVDAATYLPDTDGDKPYFVTLVQNNLQRLDIEANRGGTSPGAPIPFFAMWAPKGLNPPSPVEPDPWQIAMTLWSVDHAIDQGFTAGTAYRDRTARFINLLFNSEPGFPRWFANTTELWLGYYNADYSVTWRTSMADVYTFTAVGDSFGVPGSHGDGRRTAFAGYHGLELHAGLNVAEKLGLAGATAAHNYLLGEGDADTAGMNAYLNDRAGWAIAREGGTTTRTTTPPNRPPAAPTNVRIRGGS